MFLDGATVSRLSLKNQCGSGPRDAVDLSPPPLSDHRGASEISEREDFQERDLKRERLLNIPPKMVA